MKKSVGISVLLVVLIAGFAFGAYRLLRDTVQPLQPDDALSAGALLLLDIPDWSPWSRADAEQPILGALQQTGLLRTLDSAARRWYTPVDSAAPEVALSFSAGAYLTGAGTFDWLLVRPSTNEKEEKGEAQEKYEGIGLYRSTHGQKTWWSFHHRRIEVGSYNRVLIEDAIRQVQGRNNAPDDEGLSKLRELTGKSAEPTLLLNLRSFSAYLGMFARPEYGPALEGLARFSGWLALDLSIQQNALILSGYAAPGAEDQLARFGKADTGRIQVEGILPRNTSLIWRVGGDIKTLFRPDYLAATQDVGDPWQEFQGGEWAYAMTEVLSDSPERSALFALKLADPELAKSTLDSVSQADGQAGDIPLRRFAEGEARISIRFGRALSAFDQGWFGMSSGYLLVAAERATLVQTLDQISQQQTLAGDPAYRAFRERLLPSANAYLYLSLPGLLPLAEQIAPDRVRDSGLLGARSLQAFQPFALQFDRYRDLFLCSGVMGYGEPVRSQDQQLWSLDLDTTLAMAPGFVTDHRDRKKEILLQDKNHQLYLVDRGGKILWKRALSGPVLGEIRQLDYYKNGKLQYLFNTADQLYLIDRNGQDVADYPIALTAGSGTGVALFDYEGKRDYRLFIGGGKENVYGYYATGKPLPGWSPMKKTGALSQPVLHAVQGEKDFLVLVNRDGQVQFKDRKGDNRLSPVTIGAPLVAPLQLDRGGVEAALVSLDSLGNLIRISFSGNLQRTPLPGTDSRSRFILSNLDGAGSAELLVITGNRLTVRSADGQERWSAQLPDNGPHQFARNDNFSSGLTGVWSVSSGEWNVFNADGQLLSGFPMPGRGPFSIGPLSADAERILIGGDSRVIARRLE